MKRARSFSRPGLLVATILTLVAVLNGSAKAQLACTIQIEVVKAGFIIGAAGGSGTLTCGNKSYPLEFGGMKAGLLIGAARATYRGRVRNLRRVEDIEGTYAGAGAGIAIGGGVKGFAVANEKGVELVLSGTQVGLEGSLDFGGTVVRLRR